MLADRKRQSRKRLVMGLLLSLVLHCETATAAPDCSSVLLGVRIPLGYHAVPNSTFRYYEGTR